MEELITLIVLCYNDESNINRCLESVMNQEYRNLQIIVINDGSKDNSLQHIQKFAEKDCRIEIIDQPNKGVAESRNVGIAHARGSFVAYLDSDDYIDSGYISEMVRYQKENNADIVCSSVAWWAITGTEIHPFRICDTVTTFDDYRIILKKIYTEPRFKTGIINAFAMLVRRDLFEPGMYPTGRKCEDAWACIRLYERSRKTVLIPNILYYYQENPKSIMHTKDTGLILDEINWMTHHFDIWEQKKERELQGLISQQICYYICTNWNHVDASQKPQLYAIYKKHRKYTISGKSVMLKSRIKYFVLCSPKLLSLNVFK